MLPTNLKKLQNIFLKISQGEGNTLQHTFLSYQMYTQNAFCVDNIMFVCINLMTLGRVKDITLPPDKFVYDTAVF